jgi:hypothetical protein
MYQAAVMRGFGKMSKQEPNNPQVTLEKKGKTFNLCMCMYIYLHL